MKDVAEPHNYVTFGNSLSLNNLPEGTTKDFFDGDSNGFYVAVEVEAFYYTAPPAPY